MKKIQSLIGVLFAVIAIMLFSALATSRNSFAQTVTPSQDPVKTYNITFPITELGNCTDLSSCKTYCDDVSHQEACVAYAKEKGFYKQNSSSNTQQAILKAAQAELGCNSIDSCKAFCSQTANMNTCIAFAQKYNLSSEQTSTNLNSAKTLTEAKTDLGCTSVDSCRQICSDSQNQLKCSNFAKKVGLKGGQKTVGPGGCSSEESCKAYCSDPTHFQECTQFTQQVASSSARTTKFKGPGGCTSQNSCKEYCQKNLTICHYFDTKLGNYQASHSATQLVPTAMSKDEYCRLYPTHCVGVTPYVQQNMQISPIPTGMSPQEYCQLYPSHCPPLTPSAGTNPLPSDDQTDNQAEPSGPFPPPPSVQGIATQKTLWEYFLGFLKGW